MIKALVKGVRKMVKDNALIIEVKKQCVKEICWDSDCLYVLGMIGIGIGVAGFGLVARAIYKDKQLNDM